MFKSIRWKFAVVFIVLVMIAITLSGVFIVRFFEEYNLKNIESRLDSLSSIMLSDLVLYKDIEENADKIFKSVESKNQLGFQEEIYVISNNKIIASSSIVHSNLPEEVLEVDLLIDAMANKIQREKISNINYEYGSLKVMDKIYPINNGMKNTGYLYLRYDLKETENTLLQTKRIIFNSMLISLSLTLVLAVIISKSVTQPINAITKQAANLATGNFKNFVDVKSDDEIGELSRMFNYMSEQLDSSLNEISNEKLKLETIVNNIADGLIVINKNYEIIHINPEAKSMLKKVVKVDDAFKFSDVKTILPFGGDLNALVECEENDEIEIMNIANNYYGVRYELYQGKTSQSEGFIFIYQNVTTQENLQKLRREFVANVSHELKTPITSIKAYSETMLENEMFTSEIAEKFLTVINEEAGRMNDLVQDLLVLSNFDAKSIGMNILEVNWNNIIDDAILKVSILAKEKNQNIKVIASKDKIVSKVDAGRIKQVLINLLTNAIKYSSDNDEIEVELTQDEHSILVSVKDNGIGIPSDAIDRIFERFYRVDSGRGRDTGGTGLGLSIVKEIIEMHGGRVWIESELDEGSKVSFSIPKNVV